MTGDPADPEGVHPERPEPDLSGSERRAERARLRAVRRQRQDQLAARGKERKNQAKGKDRKKAKKGK